MRKILALAMVAMLSLAVALAAIGCGQKEESTTTTEQTPPPVETGMDTSSMMPDTMASDTSMVH